MAPAGMECTKCGTSSPPGQLVCPKCATPFNFDPNATMAGDFPGGSSSPASQETDFAATEWSVPDPAGPAAVPSTPLLPGAVLGGRYEIVQLLGEGGMGAVFRARDRELDRDVALKVIRPELANKPGVLDRFKQEIILARQVTHRNVIRIFDLGTADGIKFITMEFVEGQVLKTLLRERGKYSPEDAADLMMAVAEGLDAAHREKVIHRDLKPQNIMVDTQGRALVMDFGLADFAAGTEGAAHAGSPMGTPDYMSPEQVRCEDIDARSDVFTMGVILYELLTGKLPFDAPTPLGAMLQRVQKPARPPIEADPTIPKALNEIVVKCMAMDPAARYRSAGELLHALQVWRGVVPKAGLTRTWKWITASLATLLVVAGGIATREILNKPPPKQKTVTVLVADFQNATGDAVFDGTLEPAFITALEGASFITAYDRNEARKIAAKVQAGATRLDEGAAKLVAIRQGIGVILAGSVSKEGRSYRLSAKAMDAFAGKTISEQGIDSSTKDDVLKAAAKLAARVRKALGDRTPESLQLSAAETYGAASLEAAHAYAVARQFEGAGKADEAIQNYQHALRLDPNLGRAYANLAAIHINLGRPEEAEKYYQLAVARIDRMSDREKYKTRGIHYLMARNHEKAIEELSALVKQYPADSAGIKNLALAYFYRRDLPRALEEGRRALAIYPKNVTGRSNVALYAMYAGDFDTAAREARTVLEQNPSWELAYVALALSELAQGRPAQAVELYGRLEKVSALGASYAASGLADLALYEGRLADAAPILDKGITTDLANKNPSIAANKLVTLAQAQLLGGRKAQALAAADRAVSLSKEDGVLLAAARIYLHADREAKVRELASQLGARLAPEPQAYAKMIEGDTLLKRAKAQDAIRLYQEAQKLADTWLGRFALGRAYLEAGAFTEAYSEFELCEKRRGEATAVFLDDIPSYQYLPPVYYYLGRAQEGLKSPGAADSFKTFLAIKDKSDADPLVADARRRASR